MTQTKTKLFDTELGGIEMIVKYRELIKKFPERVEECHGLHTISEDEFETELIYVEVAVPKGQSIDILPMLSEKQKEYIIDNI